MKSKLVTGGPSRRLASGELPALAANLIATEFTEAAQATVGLTLNSHGIGLIDGPPGTGKTNAITSACRTSGHHVRYLAVPEHPSPLHLLRTLAEVLTGIEHPSESKHELENELRFLLMEFGGLLVVDEVQNLRRGGLQELRYLHDDGMTNVAIMLVGWRALDIVTDNPDLDSRIRYRTQFDTLTGAALIEALTALDPVFEKSKSSMLRRIDANYGLGNLRRWANVLDAARALRLVRIATREDAADCVALLDAASAGRM